MELTNYISIYLYLFEQEEDYVLDDYIHPLVSGLRAKKLINTYFFVRYGGKKDRHIRLRISAKKQLKEAWIIDHIRNSYSNFISSKFIHSNTRLPYHLAEYIPETERYGGRVILNSCENYFNFSSDIALELISKNKDAGYDVRFSEALMLNLIFIYHLSRHIRKDRILTLIKRTIYAWGSNTLILIRQIEKIEPGQVDDAFLFGKFKTLYDEQKDEIFQLLQKIWILCGDGIFRGFPHLKRWSRQNLDFLNQLKNVLLLNDDTAASIIGSLIHMTNNRLGIRNQDESYLAYILLNFIGQIIE